MPIALVFFVHYAYLILFLWVLVEQLGIPIPSIPVLLTAGTLSATHRVSASYALAAVLLACLIADSLWYALGRRYGGSVLRLLCRLSLEASTCVSKTEGYFTRRGPVTLLFAKFVPGLSTVAAPIAGQTGMPFSRFLLWDLAGSVIWAEAYLLSGRFFGDLAQKSAPFFHLLSRFAGVLFVLMVLGFLVQRVWKQRKFLSQVRELRLEPEELKAIMDTATEQGNTPPFIVDLRHPLDYLPDPRVLPGAIRIGPNELTQHSEIIPRDRDVILYCTCPSEETSAKVALQLHKLGIYRVRPLRGDPNHFLLL
jgi:membrane protein DedA with SNARE-associated domain/rhodanese-related sulfurtransferase